uniref:Uncharacterized protein n=1 Tax=Rhizophora mucronata TaxID=61149 RepID=A0A2P2PH71_RHIMU
MGEDTKHNSRGPTSHVCPSNMVQNEPMNVDCLYDMTSW